MPIAVGCWYIEKFCDRLLLDTVYMYIRTYIFRDSFIVVGQRKV